jgi:hypothetical protein
MCERVGSGLGRGISNSREAEPKNSIRLKVVEIVGPGGQGVPMMRASVSALNCTFGGRSMWIRRGRTAGRRAEMLQLSLASCHHPRSSPSPTHPENRPKAFPHPTSFLPTGQMSKAFTFIGFHFPVSTHYDAQFSPTWPIHHSIAFWHLHQRTTLDPVTTHHAYPLNLAPLDYRT